MQKMKLLSKQLLLYKYHTGIGIDNQHKQKNLITKTQTNVLIDLDDNIIQVLFNMHLYIGKNLKNLIQH